MHIIFQRPAGGDDPHDYQWALFHAAPLHAVPERPLSHHYTPEAALLAAEAALDLEAGALRLQREGADRFAILPR